MGLEAAGVCISCLVFVGASGGNRAVCLVCVCVWLAALPSCRGHLVSGEGGRWSGEMRDPAAPGLQGQRGQKPEAWLAARPA